jgi:hypothetical protein
LWEGPEVNYLEDLGLEIPTRWGTRAIRHKGKKKEVRNLILEFPALDRFCTKHSKIYLLFPSAHKGVKTVRI